MKLQIRNMQSERCITLVQKVFFKLGISYHNVNLEGVTTKGNVTVEELLLLDIALKLAGLELISDKKMLLMETIKECIDEYISLNESATKENLSDFLSHKLDCDYSILSAAFSIGYGSSIEKFLIVQKIKQVKVLLRLNVLSLNDIAYQLHYSSTAHLSNQFKKATGNTLAFFRANA